MLFPRAYNLDNNKNSSVSEKVIIGGNNWLGRDVVRDGRTKDEIDRISALISSTVLNEKEDIWCCPGGPKDMFTVAWLRKRIKDKNQMTIGKNRWCKWIPKRSNILI